MQNELKHHLRVEPYPYQRGHHLRIETSAKRRLSFVLKRIKQKKDLKRHKFAGNAGRTWLPLPIFPPHLMQLDTIIPGVRYKL